jgi:hypothetical protein
MKRCLLALTRKVALAAIALGASLAVLEVTIRVLGLAPSPSRTDALQKVIEFDGKLETRYKANAHTSVNSQYGEFAVSYTFNNLGLRDRPLEDKAHDDCFRVLALGNSFVEGWGVAAEDMFLRIAEQQCNAGLHRSKKRPVRIINAGASGYGAIQSYLFLQELLDSTQPDAVVFFYIPTMVSADQKFLLRASTDSQGLATGLNMDVFTGKAATQLPDTASGAGGIGSVCASRSALVRFVATCVENIAARKQIAPGDPLKDLLAAYRAPSGTLARLHEPTFLHLDAMANLAKQSNIPFMTVYLPMPFEVSSVEWAKGRTIYGIDQGPDAYAEPGQLAAARFQQAGIPWISARDVLAAKSAQRAHDALLFFSFDFHLNKDGQKVVGDWLGNELVNRLLR